MEQTNQGLEATPQAETVPLRPMNMAATLAICSGGWLVPGLSHILIGRWIRGVIFAACVLAMFVLGLGMHGKLYDPSSGLQEPLHIFAFIANAGAGLPYLIAERLDMGVGVMTAPSYDYGTTYLWVCGLLNYLIVLDAFDIAQARKP
ncbi:MAG: hypothetical protein DMG13_09800 [Acidobacteria bacterium]|nr:MAG: hypothetical protein DMG13_09800 [Acidobacteriota bacterium]